MLEIIVDDQNVDLSIDFSFTYEKKSPLFMDDTIEGSLGYDMEFPDTPHNRTIFGFPARLEIVREKKKFSVRVLFSGRLLINGTIEISQTTKGSYSAYLTDSAGTIADEAKDLNIRNVDYGSDITIVNKGVYTIGEDDYCLFPVQNNIFFKEKGYPYESGGTTTYPMNDKFLINGAKQNKYYSSGDNFYKYTWDGIDTNHRYDNIYAITPFPFLNAVLRRFFATLSKAWVPGELATDEDMKRFCFYNNYDVTSYQTAVVSKPVHLSFLFISVDFTVNITRTTIPQLTTFKWKNIIPDITVKDLLISIQSLLCGAFDFHPDGRVTWISKKSVIESIDAEDWTEKIIDGIDTDEFVEKGLSIEWDQDDKDQQLSFVENDYIKNKWDKFKGTKATAEEVFNVSSPEVGDIWFAVDADAFFEFMLSEVDEAGALNQTLLWVRKQYNNVSMYYKLQKDENMDFTSKISSIWLQSSEVPIVNIEGSRIDYPREDYPCGARLMMYNGKISSTPSGYSLRARNPFTGEDWDGRKLSIAWYGPDGLFNQRWKTWADFLINAIPISFNALLSPVDIEQFDFTKKKSIRQGHMLIESFSVNISLDKIDPAEVKARFIRPA